LNTESYQKAIESATKRLYEAAQAADLTTEKFSNASGVALKFLYTPLDLKVKNTEIEFKESLQFFVQLFNEFLELTGRKKLQGKVSFEFNHDQIINELERTQTQNLQTTTAMMLQSILPLEKVLEELPQVDNVEETLKQIENERTNELRNITVNENDS
jgi:SPP1 family phage portal protein